MYLSWVRSCLWINQCDGHRRLPPSSQHQMHSKFHSVCVLLKYISSIHRSLTLMWPGVPSNETTALQSEIFFQKASGLMKNIDADKVRCGSCMPWLQNSYFKKQQHIDELIPLYKCLALIRYAIARKCYFFIPTLKHDKGTQGPTPPSRRCGQHIYMTPKHRHSSERQHNRHHNSRISKKGQSQNSAFPKCTPTTFNTKSNIYRDPHLERRGK